MGITHFPPQPKKAPHPGDGHGSRIEEPELHAIPRGHTEDLTVTKGRVVKVHPLISMITPSLGDIDLSGVKMVWTHGCGAAGNVVDSNLSGLKS